MIRASVGPSEQVHPARGCVAHGGPLRHHSQERLRPGSLRPTRASGQGGCAESHTGRVASRSLGTCVPAKWAFLVDAERGIEGGIPSGALPARRSDGLPKHWIHCASAAGQVAFAVLLRGVIPGCDKAAADAAATGGPRHVSQTSAWMRLAPMGQTSDPAPRISPRFGACSPRQSGPWRCVKDQPCRLSVMSKGAKLLRGQRSAPAGITEHAGQPGIFPDESDGDAVIDLAFMEFPDQGCGNLVARSSAAITPWIRSAVWCSG